MNLDEAQRRKVAEWIAQGLKLSDIQNRLAADLGMRMTYMEVRLLVDDLKLVPKDVEPAKPIESVLYGPRGDASRRRPATEGPTRTRRAQTCPAWRRGGQSVCLRG